MGDVRPENNLTLGACDIAFYTGMLHMMMSTGFSVVQMKFSFVRNKTILEKYSDQYLIHIMFPVSIGQKRKKMKNK